MNFNKQLKHQQQQQDQQEEEEENVWPEESSLRYTKSTFLLGVGSWIRKFIYDRLYYSYMNTILQKGAKLHKQRKKQREAEVEDEFNTQIIHELSHEDLFPLPKGMQSQYLLMKFHTLYQQQLKLEEEKQQQGCCFHSSSSLKKKKKKTSKTTSTTTTSTFIRVLWNLIGPTYYIPGGMYQLITVILQTCYPLVVRQLLFLLQQSPSSSASSSSSSFYIQGFLYSILLFIIMFMDGLAQERVKFLSFQSGITLRAATISAVYNQTLRVKPLGQGGGQSSSQQQQQYPILTSGEVTNLVAIDCQKLFEVTQEGHLIWSTPLSMLMVTILLLITLGPSTLVGMVSMFLFIPLVQRVVSAMMNVRKKRIHYTDIRIQTITVLLSSIRFCKLNHYELKFLQRIEEARNMERIYVRKELAFFAMTMFLTVITPVLACAVTFTAYVFIGGERNVLTPADTFTTLIFFTALRFPINYAGKLMGKLSQGLHACQRLSQFFARDMSSNSSNSTVEENPIYTHGQKRFETSMESLELSNKSMEDTNQDQNCRDDKHDSEYHLEEEPIAVRVNHGSFVVGSSNSSNPNKVIAEITTNSSNSSEESMLDPVAIFNLSDICFEVRKCTTLAVVGSVGSGKSSLLNALLGNVSCIDNNNKPVQMNSKVVELNGRIAYASQVPFILNGTVRENILFGLPYNQDLYERVLDACNLVADLQQLGMAADLTEIGERGVTLSGGQKARVSLARCVYSQSDIVLLDDILSALDAATGKAIFDSLLDNTGPSNGLLKNAAVILVTHSTHFLSRMDSILVLSKGKSIFYGTWKELIAYHPPEEDVLAIHNIVSSVQEDKTASDESTENGIEQKHRNNYDSEKSSKESGRLMTGKSLSLQVMR